ncbi:Gmad2 immunoglobulin-like domain-containing protein [Mechercharimyces sp. CAU 1602]|uniref:Gmad2 immunoglobulin-like domain-containing protein n=1 Tax=Mechercharimyces sp. CAU 1602 TaxID=2973933 RepID=UPI0021632DD5|nr:Gmad2 immunoglobulin-like domain-containing protein [Mechercharimyces sp. CAU 1602]MCS1350934.1 Gmad2 immunoglobulin-like domain-containing protein [Mechercharimyces sp. CAU 1602]
MKKTLLVLVCLLLLSAPNFDAPAIAKMEDRSVFRQVEISDASVQFQITGEARAFEGAYSYAVKNGDELLSEGHGQASVGAPSWGEISFNVNVARDSFPTTGSLFLELYEYSARDGSIVNVLRLPLQAGEYEEENIAFRQLSIAEPTYHYMLTGQARTFEGAFHYAVSDGHNYLLEGNGTASKGAPLWGDMSEELIFSQSTIPVNGTLVLELYYMDAKTGRQILDDFYVVDRFPW